MTYSVNWFQVRVHNVKTAHRCVLCSLLTASVATTCQCNLLFRWSCFSSLLVFLGKKSEFLWSQMYIRKASLPQDFCFLWRDILDEGKSGCTNTFSSAPMPPVHRTIHTGWTRPPFSVTICGRYLKLSMLSRFCWLSFYRKQQSSFKGIPLL